MPPVKISANMFSAVLRIALKHFDKASDMLQRKS